MSTQEPRTKFKHFLVLGLIFAAIVGFQISINESIVNPTLWQIIIIPVGDDSGYDMATLMYMSGSAITAFASFVVAKRYVGSAMFTKAYFCLGIGFCFWFIGDNLFFYDAYVEELTPIRIPYIPGEDRSFILKPADFVYLGIYPGMALHLYLNTNWFEKNKLKKLKKSAETKFFLFGVPIIGAIIYFLQFDAVNADISGLEAINFESGFGALNAVGASVTLGLVFWGARVFKASALAPAWTLLLLGLFFSTIGDYLYYQVEQFNENYQIYSLSTTFYLLTFSILTYGLYKHTKIV
ncbi:MAG: hypothetical protein ACREAK_03075 [Nitrosarchaeum sp.]